MLDRMLRDGHRTAVASGATSIEARRPGTIGQRPTARRRRIIATASMANRAATGAFIRTPFGGLGAPVPSRRRLGFAALGRLG
jgi:hypothetical protein